MVRFIILLASATWFYQFMISLGALRSLPPGHVTGADQWEYGTVPLHSWFKYLFEATRKFAWVVKMYCQQVHDNHGTFTCALGWKSP